MFKIKHGMLPSSVTELFNTSHTNYNLRNADFRGKCFNTTKYGKKGIRKRDIALLIDDSCNDCPLQELALIHLTILLLFRVTQFTIQRYY